MKNGVKLLELELGKKSDNYKLKYNKMCKHIINKLKGVYDEVELIDKFNFSIRKFKSEKNTNKLFHSALDTGDFDNYNLYFIMKDCFEKFQMDVNLFTMKGKYFVKTENFYIMQNKIIVNIDEFPFNEEVYVLNKELILTKEYERLMKFYSKLNPNKSILYKEKVELAINNFYELMGVLKINYNKLNVELFDEIRKGYEDYETNYMRGEILLREKRYYEAEKEFGKVLSVDKKYNNVQFDIGYSLYKQGNYNGAIKYLDDTTLKDSEVLYHMGLCYYKMKKYDTAIQYFNETLLTNEKNENAYVYLASCNMKKANFETAKDIIYMGRKILGERRNFIRMLKMISKRESSYVRPYIRINNENETYRILKEVKA